MEIVEAIEREDRKKITLETLEQNNGVNEFIQKVLDQIYTEDEGMTIKAELQDHILSLAEDYAAAGHSIEASIRKALYQMGDPAEIGYSFTDYEGMKRRRRLLVGFKVLALAIMIGVTAFVIWVSSGSTPEPDTVVNANAHHDGGLDRIMSLYYLIYFPVLFWINIKSQSQNGIGGIPVKKLKISKEPLLVLWSYKKRFPLEYLVLSVFFVPIILTFAVIFISEGSSPFSFFGVIFAFVLGIWLLMHSEKYRIPKYMIMEEGIVIKNSLVSWTTIDRIYWTKDYLSTDKGHYKLTIEHIYRVSNQAKGKYRYNNMTVKRNIEVNANQYLQVNSLIKERI